MKNEGRPNNMEIFVRESVEREEERKKQGYLALESAEPAVTAPLEAVQPHVPQHLFVEYVGRYVRQGKAVLAQARTDTPSTARAEVIADITQAAAVGRLHLELGMPRHIALEHTLTALHQALSRKGLTEFIGGLVGSKNELNLPKAA